MADGVIMSPAFNEQVKRFVREAMRRERSTQNPQGRWHGRGSGGGTVTSDCCGCVCNPPDMVYPIAGFLTCRKWAITLTKTPELHLSDDESCYVTVEAGTSVVEWSSGTELWSVNLGGRVKAYDLDGVTLLETPSSISGTIVMSWVSGGDLTVTYTYTAVA